MSATIPRTRSTAEFELASAIFERQSVRGATRDGALAYLAAVFDLEAPQRSSRFANTERWLRATCACGAVHRGWWF